VDANTTPDADARARDHHHVLSILGASTRDPALSGGCPLLAELFVAIAEEDVAEPLLRATPEWKIPGLLLSAALLYRASADGAHPLRRFLAGCDAPLDSGFRAAVRQAIAGDAPALAALLEKHTYQCNPPRRIAVSLIVLAAVGADLARRPFVHVDVGTASGIGLLLGQARARTGDASLGPADALLELPVELRGAPLEVGALPCPAIERALGIDLDPPDLRDRECRAWIRACQFPLAAELDFFDRAVDLVLARRPRIERGAATDWLPRLAGEMPAGQPLVVTDTYVAVFMSESEREQLRRELDAIARTRPVVWISNNPVVPFGENPDRTTAGLMIPDELRRRNRSELFGAVCATTWPQGRRSARLVALTHPGGCWLEWRPDLATSTPRPRIDANA
jgi:hypothetical protein